MGIKHSRPVPPFMRYCSAIIPTMFDDSLSYYEALCALNRFIQTNIVEVINNNASVTQEYIQLVDELKSYVEHYFDNLDVQEEINNKLDAMAEDGSLTSLLSKVINPKSLTGHTFYRDCSEWIDGVTEETSENPIKGYLGGITTTPSSLIMAINAGGSYANITNNAYLVEVSKDTKATLKEAFIEINHANAIAYNAKDGIIYVASNTKYVDGETVQWNKIVRVDYETFNVIDEIEIPESITSAYISGVSYDNKNDVLAISTPHRVYVMNSDLTEVLEEIVLKDQNGVATEINPLFGNHTIQYNMLYDNKIYQVRFFADGINIYDRDGNLTDSIYNFDFEVPLGEFESLAVEEDGTAYVAQVQISASNKSCFLFYDRVITETNLISGGYKNQYKKEYNQTVGTWGNRVYVNPNTTNKIQAGSSTYPYKHIQQAIIDSNLSDIPYYIDCAATANYGFIIARNNTPIYVNGNSKATFYGMITQKQNITVSNATFDLSNDFEVATGWHNIYNESSESEFNACTFTGKNDKSSEAIGTLHGELLINGCTFTNFVDALKNSSSVEVTIFAPSFSNCTYNYKNTNYVAIHRKSSTIYKECDPSGELPYNVDGYQDIKGEVNGNSVAFNCNLSSVLVSSAILTITAKRGSETYYKSFNSRCVANTVSVVGNTATTILFLEYTHTWTNTGLVYTPKVYELTIADGSVADVTSAFTFSYGSILVR